MIRPPPRSTRTDTLFPYTTLFRSATRSCIAFSNASVALVHGMSRPIGAHFHVPHGLSNAMLLPTVTRWSLDAALDRYAEAGRQIGAARRTASDEAAAGQLLAWLFQEIR